MTEGISLTSTDNVNWITQYTVLDNDTNGLISFSISSPNLYTTFTETTDLSRVTIDTLAPSTPISSPISGIYATAQSVSLASTGHSVIHFTLDGSIPSCTQGNVYLLPFAVSTSKIVKSVACDLAYNQSSLLTLSISIFPDTFTLDTTTEDEEEIQLEESEVIQNILETGGDSTEEDKVIPIFKVRILDNKYNPIPNLPITINSKPQTTKTDINGIAVFTNIPFGTHTLIYSYKDTQYSEKISANEEYIKENNIVEILDIVTKEEGNINTYLIPIGIFVFILLIFIIVRGIVKNKKIIDKEEVSV